MKNKINITQPKETNKGPTTDSKHMEICELTAKEFRRILLKKFRIHRKLNKIKKIMHEKVRSSTKK